MAKAPRQDRARHRLRHGPAPDPARPSAATACRASTSRPRTSPSSGSGRRRRASTSALHVADMTRFKLPSPVDAAICMQDSQGPPAHERGHPGPPPLRGQGRPQGRALRLRPLHVLVVDRPGAALVLDEAARAGDGARDLRGPQGPQPGDADLLRGHGARGPRGRPPARRHSASATPPAWISDSKLRALVLLWPGAGTWSNGSTGSRCTSSSTGPITRS